MHTNKGLPVAGYHEQTDTAVGQVNRHKVAEEQILRMLDQLSGLEGIDQRWLAIGRTQIELGFMAVNRAVFRPGRIDLTDVPGA